MFLNIKTNKNIIKSCIAVLVGVFLLPLFSYAQGWTWDHIFPGSLSLTSGNERVQMVEYGGDLYAGIGEGGESQVFRYLSGNNWEQVNTNAFGIDVETGVTAMEEYNGYLYVGDRYLPGGGYVLRTQAQGGPPFTDWTDANLPGFGDVNNEKISALKSFGGYLYAATYNTVTGAEIWRTQGVGGPPFTDWTQVNTNGFSDLNNEDILALHSYGGYLYASTSKAAGGGELWRTNNGVSWNQVQTDGLGNVNNTALTSFSNFDGSLYLGSKNNTGGNLYRSSNGNFWNLVGSGGLVNSNNEYIHPLLSIDNYLYLGSKNNTQGAALYRTSDNQNYERINTYGFGSSAHEGFSALEFNNALYVNASRATGAEIYVNHGPQVSNVVASQNQADKNKINISFRVNDQEEANNILARLEYNIGSGWNKATVLVNDNDTTATYGDPKVSNVQDYQLGTAQGYLETSSGINTIDAVWDYSVDQPGLMSNNVRVRVRADDQILESEYAESQKFTIESVLPVSLTKSFTINSPAPAPAASADNAQLISFGSIINQINIPGLINNDLFRGSAGNIVLRACLTLSILLILILFFQWWKRGWENNHRFRTINICILLGLSISSIGIISFLRDIETGSASPYDVYPTDSITYRVEYQNSSDQDIHDFYILDEIPQYTSYVLNSLNLNGIALTDALDIDQGDYNISNIGKITVYVGSVPVNSGGYIEFKVDVNDNAPMGAVIENQARGAFNPGNTPIFSNIIKNYVIAVGSIAGKVFYDSNQNQLLDSGEAGIANAEVKLYEDINQDGLFDPITDQFVVSAIAGSDGEYNFSGLSAKFYLIYVEGYSVPASYILTTGNNPAQAVLTTSFQQYQNANFGYYNQPQLPTTPPATTTPTIPPTTTTIPDEPKDTEEIPEPKEDELEIIREREDFIEKDEVRQQPQEDVESIKPVIKPVVDAPEQTNLLDSLIKYSAPLVALLSLANIFSAIPLTQFINFLKYLFQLFTQPFLLFSRKKQKSLGVVYDSLTKLPIDLALVRLYDQSTSKLVETRVTNRKGQYLFIVEKGRKYFIKVKKENYVFPSQKMNFAPGDGLYENNYYGNVISFTENDPEAGKISRNIPMDLEEGKSYGADSDVKTLPTKVKNIDDYNRMSEAEKLADSQRIKRHLLFKKINRFIAYIGPLYALVSFFINPSLLTFVFLMIHALLLLIFIRLAKTNRLQSWGRSYELKSSKGIANSVVRLFDQKYGKLLLTTLSKSDGRYGFLTGPNNYLLSAYKNNYEMPEGKLEIVSKENGVVKKDIGMKKIS